MPKVVTGIPKISTETITRYKNLSVATVHEAQGRTGLLSPDIKPIQLIKSDLINFLLPL